MAHKFDEFLYKEVFVVGPDNDANTAKETHIFENFEDLMQHMKTLSIEDDADMRILHGYLTPAEVLPSSIRNKSVFIITTDEDDDQDTAITEVEPALGVEKLADEIKDIVKDGLTISFTTNIDSTFLLYGYEINKILAPDDDDLDEEALSTCKKIAEEVEKIRDRNEDQITNGKESGFTPEGL
jgi:hypothetical protein